ncbi:MAG: hypothetical protein O3C34_20950 [Proteobacteria bacterium]|nr:hypothetical protein [Pseudomonadota bacterium]
MTKSTLPALGEMAGLVHREPWLGDGFAGVVGDGAAIPVQTRHPASRRLLPDAAKPARAATDGSSALRLATGYEGGNLPRRIMDIMDIMARGET